jgi:NADH-quinone oxidoreductase subunit G
LRRTVNRYNSEVNGYFLCDRGRFGFDFVNNRDRLLEPVQRVDNTGELLADDQVKALIKEFTTDGTIGIGSPRASNESNFALRAMVGEENFYAGYSDVEHESMKVILDLASDTAFHSPSVREIETADAVLILGEDVTNVAPRIALALRQSVRNKAKDLAEQSRIPQWQDAAVRELAQHERSPLSIISPAVSRLDDVASDRVIESLSIVAAMGHQIANKILTSAPNASSSTEHDEVIEKIAEQLKAAKRPLIIAGNSNGSEVIKAAANIARALHDGSDKSVIDLCLLVPEVNSMGMGLMVGASNPLGAGLEKLQSGEAKRVIVLENDLYRRAAKATVDAALTAAAKVLVLDQLPTATTANADVILPATAFSEHEATYINYEGRAQLSFQVHQCQKQAQPSWRWLCDVEHIDDLVERCSNELPGFARLGEVLPKGNPFIAGMKVPRQSHRYSGRTAMNANVNVHEPKQMEDKESVMSFSMEGIPSQKDASVLASSWAPKWNSNQSISKFQDEVNGELKQGHVGCLLIERKDSSGSYFEAAPDSAGPSANQLRLVFSYQIFGSDELSARAKPIQARMTDAYIGLSPADAKARDLRQGDVATISPLGSPVVVCIRTGIKAGTALLYCGDGNISPADFSGVIEVEKNATQSTIRGIGNLIVSDFQEEEINS